MEIAYTDLWSLLLQIKKQKKVMKFKDKMINIWNLKT